MTISYWKGLAGTPKAGQYGSFDADAPFVSDADKCTEQEYQVWQDAQKQTSIHTESDIEKLLKYAKLQGWI